MSNSRQLSIVGALAFIVFMFGFGTEAGAQTTCTWDGGGVNTNWSNVENWDQYGVPTSSDNVIFPSSGTPWNVAISSPVTIGDLRVYGSVALTGPVSGAGLICNNLTISNANLILDYATGPRNTSFIISAKGLTLTSYTKIMRPTGYTAEVYIELGRGENGTISMDNVTNSYIDEGIFTWIDNQNAFGVSETRFDDAVTFTTAANNVVPLGDYNLYLGQAAADYTDPLNPIATVFGLAGTPGGSGGYIATKQGATPNLKDNIGRLCFEYFDDGRTYDFLIGPDTPGGKCAPISLKVDGTPLADPNATPFPYISARVVNEKHPENKQVPNYQLYWVVQGVGTPETYTDPATSLLGSICLKEVKFWYLQTKMSAGANYDIYPARFVHNYEDYPNGGNPIGLWTPTGGPKPKDVVLQLTMPDPTPCEMDQFGDFSVGVTGTNPMPVELTSFSARVVDDQVKLNWETASELNNYGFYVERSVDRENWKEISFVPGYGTSFSPKNYVYFDELGDELQRLPELSYRLRQVDRDGTTDYSNIVNVNTGELPEGVELYAAYPNPFNPATTISFAIGSPARVTLKVYNTLGQAVATILSGSAMDAGLHTVGFDGAQLPSGVYLAVLEANGAVQHQKLVLNK